MTVNIADVNEFAPWFMITQSARHKSIIENTASGSFMFDASATDGDICSVSLKSVEVYLQVFLIVFILLLNSFIFLILFKSTRAPQTTSYRDFPKLKLVMFDTFVTSLKFSENEILNISYSLSKILNNKTTNLSTNELCTYRTEIRIYE